MENSPVNYSSAALTNILQSYIFKDLHLQDNPIKDNRLAKLIKQCHTKAVLDYIAVGNEKGKSGKRGGKKGRNKKHSEGDTEAAGQNCDTQVGPVITVVHSDGFKVLVKGTVQDVRPYIVCAVIRNLDLSDMATFRKFINIQVCYIFYIIKFIYYCYY